VSGLLMRLPLVFGAQEIALGFSTVNPVILLHRVRLEDRELSL